MTVCGRMYKKRGGRMVAKEDRPVISVIVPVYNVESWVGTCLDSIMAQTY